jgi:microcin C transport system substrate-binding protein
MNIQKLERVSMSPFRLLLTLLVACLLPPSARAEDLPIRHHALSLIGEPKYPADFKSFDYVNPDAPKGGVVRMADIGSFDSLNPVLYKGEAAGGLALVFESLMADSLDEPSTSYGLIAEWASYPPDYSSVTFKLRDEARWQDGTPITPDDVIYSLGVNKDANPRMGLYYKNVSRAEATGPNEVTFYFDVKNNRELPMIMGQLTILPKHYWTGKDASGNQRDPMKTTLEPPLGSGPYRIKDVKPGRSIAYQRVADYWGKDLPVNKGAWNYDEVRFDYYRDETVAFESFKAGNLDYWQEASAKNWATAYDFAAVRDGYVKRQEVAIKRERCSACTQSPASAVGIAACQTFNLPRFRGPTKFVLRPIAGRRLPGGELAAWLRRRETRSRILNEVKDGVPPQEYLPACAMPIRQRNNDDARANLRKPQCS